METKWERKRREERGTKRDGGMEVSVRQGDKLVSLETGDVEATALCGASEGADL